MTVRLEARTAFTLGLTLAALALLVLSLRLGRAAGLVVILVSLPTSAALVVQLIAELREDASAKAGGQDKPGRGRRELALLGWIGGLVLLVYLAGLTAALPIFAVAYLRMSAGESWLVSLTMGVAVWAVVYLVFGLLLETRLYEGWLQSALSS